MLKLSHNTFPPTHLDFDLGTLWIYNSYAGLENMNLLHEYPPLVHAENISFIYINLIFSVYRKRELSQSSLR